MFAARFFHAAPLKAGKEPVTRAELPHVHTGQESSVERYGARLKGDLDFVGLEMSSVGLEGKTNTCY